MDDVADRIKMLRMHLNFTQEQLGKSAGVSKAAVSQWERGISKPERDALDSLQLNLRVNPQWVTTGKGEMLVAALKNEVSEDSPQYNDPKLQDIANIFVQLSAEAQDQIISLAKLLSRS